jgi:hypothetical protein
VIRETQTIELVSINNESVIARLRSLSLESQSIITLIINKLAMAEVLPTRKKDREKEERRGEKTCKGEEIN